MDNLVIVGMGEPLANYENLLRALAILNAPWGGAIGARKITISTSGLAPQPFIWTATVENILAKIERARAKLERVNPGCTQPRQRKTKQQ